MRILIEKKDRRVSYFDNELEAPSERNNNSSGLNPGYKKQNVIVFGAYFYKCKNCDKNTLFPKGNSQRFKRGVYMAKYLS